MRTYGEGFIIADQSPSAVDISAIRNTNTKIIMRLPDEQDRELAGKAAALKDEQLDEIARFPKGVAVVYQNDWMEPVLCKVSKFDTEEQPDVLKKKSTIVSRKNEEQLLLRNLLKKEEGEALELNLQQLKERVLRLTLPTKTKIAALKALQKNGRCAPKDIQGVVYDLICTPMVEKDLDDPALEAVEDKNLLPFAIDPFGNYICYQLNEKQIVYWDHENDAVTTTGKSLKEFIESLY